MGLASSKVRKQLSSNDLQEGSIPSTPILASKIKEIRQDDLDPRSPSMHISRTPLQLLSGDSLSLNAFQECDLTSTTDETPAKPKSIFLGIDPRSPTEEFTRTPIIITAPEAEAPEKIRNKKLDKVKRSVIHTTPKSTSKKQVLEKTPSNLPLGSSPLRSKLESHKRKSFVGLLETNIDFTETDLDAVIREKSKIKETISDPVTPIHKQIADLVQRENIDPRSPTHDFVRTPIQDIKKIAEKTESDFKCVGEDIKENDIAAELEDHNIIKICVQEICESVHLKTELELSESNEEQLILSGDAHVSLKTLVNSKAINESDTELENTQDKDIVEAEIPVQTMSAPITPPSVDGQKSVMSTPLKETKSAPVTPPLVNVPDVKEFDKKLTSLIYQDEDIVICPRKVKLKDYDSRSPLRNVNRGEPEKKSAQKLKATDKMKKSEFAVSKIPVFKENSGKPVVQCENTPPRNMEKRKVKVRKSHWDNADATLII